MTRQRPWKCVFFEDIGNDFIILRESIHKNKDSDSEELINKISKQMTDFILTREDQESIDHKCIRRINIQMNEISQALMDVSELKGEIPDDIRNNISMKISELLKEIFLNC